MATQIVLEKATGNFQSMGLPLFVFNDDGAELSETDAINAVEAAAGITVPTTFNGFPDDGNPGMLRLSKSSWRVTIQYREPNLRNLRPPETGTARNAFNFQLGRKYVQFAPVVNVYPGGEPDWGGLVEVKQDCNSGQIVSGTWVDPPPASFVTENMIDPSTITASWIRTLAAVIQAGGVNNASMGSGAYAEGELMIVYCTGQQASDSGFRIETGWSWQQNVSGQTRDTVTGVAYDGQDLAWNYLEPFCDRNDNRLGARIRSVHVNQIRPRMDLSATGLSPP